MKAQRWIVTGLLVALAGCTDTGLGPAATTDARVTEESPDDSGAQAGHVVLNPKSVVIQVGSSILFETRIRGRPAVAVAWSTADSTIARVGAEGLVTALRPGETTVSATSPDGVVAGRVTVQGPDAVLATDGLKWKAMVSGEGLAPLYDVWGTSANDVFAVGSSMLWDCCGTILHFDGAGWSYMPAPQGVAELQGVWGSSRDDVFAVGASGVIVHYDGATWSAMPSPTRYWLEAVWGTSPTNVFAVGSGGVVLHYDGAGWSMVRSPDPRMDVWLTDIWGTSASDIFAVGSGILHYDGRNWSPMSTPAVNMLHGVWGTGSDDVFAVGAGGAVLHYDGHEWSRMSTPTRDGDLLGIWGSSATDVYAVGDRNWWGPGCCSDLLHYDGTGWRILQHMTGQAVFDAWTTPDAAFLVGSGPTIIQGTR